MAKKRTKKPYADLSQSMRRVLRNLYNGRPADAHCRTMSDHGGLYGTLMALWRRKYLDIENELTPAGEAVCKALFGEKSE